MHSKLEALLTPGKNYIESISEPVLTHKPASDKWSKKEILGHLIDSGINNLQRFTEIQFKEKPFQIYSYNQDDLVKANQYQEAETKQLLELWLALNYRIARVMENQTAESLSFEIVFSNGEITDLKFLMEDYVDHLEHHLQQLMN